MAATNLTRTELRPLSDVALLAVAARCVERAAVARESLHALPKKHLMAWKCGYAQVLEAIGAEGRSEGRSHRPSLALASTIRSAGTAVYWDLDKKGHAYARLVSSSYEVAAAAVEAASGTERKPLVSGVISTAGALRSLAARLAHEGYVGGEDPIAIATQTVFSAVRTDIDTASNTNFDATFFAGTPLWVATPAWWPSR